MAEKVRVCYPTSQSPPQVRYVWTPDIRILAKPEAAPGRHHCAKPLAHQNCWPIHASTTSQGVSVTAQSWCNRWNPGDRSFCTGADLKKTMPPSEAFAELHFESVRPTPNPQPGQPAAQQTGHRSRQQLRAGRVALKLRCSAISASLRATRHLVCQRSVLTSTVLSGCNAAAIAQPEPGSQGSPYQIERPPPCRTSNPFLTKRPNIVFNVFGLAPDSRTMSRVVTRP